VPALCASVWPAGPAKPAPLQSRPAPGFDVNQLFASTCGWCHLKGGREAGKGPKLAGTQLPDSEIIARIRNGKPGQMPAFGSAFNDAQLKAIVDYIRELKP